jgi:hypothetical protein
MTMTPKQEAAALILIGLYKRLVAEGKYIPKEMPPDAIQVEIKRPCSAAGRDEETGLGLIPLV